METTAEWVDIPNHPNYEASSLGEVRNKKNGKTLKPFLCGNYWRHSLPKEDGGLKHWRRCRLIAIAFKLPKRDDQNQVDHINGDAHDDRVCNLRWRSAKENMRDRIALKGTIRDSPRVYLKFDSEKETIYFPSIQESCRHFDRAMGTMWGIYKMAQFKGKQRWCAYTVTIIDKATYDAIETQ